MSNTKENLIIRLPSWFERELTTIYSSEEARSMARRVMEDLTGKSYARLMADNDVLWSPDQKTRIIEIIEMLKTHEPLQYILGYEDFMEMRFEVQRGVLIPRGETEGLVYWIRDDLKKQNVGRGKDIRILDIGCGTGIIGICLAKEFPDARVTCCDAYSIPLEVTARNALLNDVDIEIKKIDILQINPESLEAGFDVIVSNPPYVTSSQASAMQSNVLDYEPSSALFVTDENPLIFYKEICKYASKNLSNMGNVYFEINEILGSETKDLVNSYFKFVELRKDIHNKDRMIKANYGF